MKIYIAGKITGEPLEECIQKFEAAEKKIRDLGAVPINPFKLGIPRHFTYEESKPFNFKALRQCHAIFMLTDYVTSEGAMDEHGEAMRLRLDIFYEQFEGYEAIDEAVKLRIISPGY